MKINTFNIVFYFYQTCFTFNSFIMAHQCCQIKFSLDNDVVNTTTTDYYLPIKTRHSSFIMRLKSNTKNKITKYKLVPRKQSLLDDLSNCLNSPIPKHVTERSK
jgi:hypothetical protein